MEGGPHLRALLPSPKVAGDRDGSGAMREETSFFNLLQRITAPPAEDLIEVGERASTCFFRFAPLIRTLSHSYLDLYWPFSCRELCVRTIITARPMSCDFFVWYPQEQISNAQATKLYLRLCDGDASALVPHPSIDAFYAELTARHPEIDAVPEDKAGDYDCCPWSCKLDFSPSYILMCCVWSKADYVGQLVESLAHKHGLAVYDPQSEKAIYPDGTIGADAGTTATRTSLWTLAFFGLLFAAMFVYSAWISTSPFSIVLYIFGALCALMVVVCVRQAWKRSNERKAGSAVNSR